jgi:hypothetical protein
MPIDREKSRIILRARRNKVLEGVILDADGDVEDEAALDMLCEIESMMDALDAMSDGSIVAIAARLGFESDIKHL